MLTILAVGEDFELLKTRAEVLRTTGANVICSSGLAALRFIEERELDLIVLCHSLGERDAVKITEAAHRQGSGALVLHLVSGLEREESSGAAYDAETSAEPYCLVHSTSELLKRQMKETTAVERIKWDRCRRRPQSYPALISRFERLRAG